MAFAETFILQTFPSITARIFWMFGLNFLFVIPVTFLPTPPRCFALPRLLMDRPEMVRLPVKHYYASLPV
jgi:hypothetical protein